ncbi:MAG: abortive infection family protein [Candidatus Nanopelagicales bacterium]
MVKLAVGKCLGAVMDKARWAELGLLTGSTERIQGHSRLLRALYWGDDDYQGAVYDVLPAVLGEVDRGAVLASHGAHDLSSALPNLGTVSDYLELPDWLAENDPDLYAKVCTGSDADATLPDGTMLDAAEAAASRLEVAEMRRQVERIRRDYAGDPEALVGQAKELIETACKTILGITGAGPETHYEVPELVNKTLIHLGLHPKDADKKVEDPAEARALKRVFGGLSSVLTGTAELRNARGTGHGRSGAPLVDERLARMTAGMVLPGIVYLCEIYEHSVRKGATPANTGNRTDGADVRVGSVVSHRTFGRGRVVAAEGQGPSLQVVVDFEGVGAKRLLVRYAPMLLMKE